MSPFISSRFSRCPVDRSSITRTRNPCCASASARWEPMKPAPPVTTALPVNAILFYRYRQLWLTTDSDVFEAQFSHILRLVDVPQVRNLRTLHQIANSCHVESTELVPFSNEN